VKDQPVNLRLAFARARRAIASLPKWQRRALKTWLAAVDQKMAADEDARENRRRSGWDAQ
jgi:hypothetical protein